MQSDRCRSASQLRPGTTFNRAAAIRHHPAFDKHVDLAPHLLLPEVMELSFSRQRFAVFRSARAFSFLEVMGAIMVVALFLSGTFVANSRALGMLRASKETITASKLLQERMEQLRMLNWAEITDASSIQDLFATQTNSASLFTGESESVTISKWPLTSGTTSSTSIKVNRAANGTVTLVSDNADLVDGTPTVRVDVSVTWPGTPGNRTRIRETSTIVANGGLGG